VPIRIKQIDIIGVAKAVSARAILDAVAQAQAARDVASPDDVVDTTHDVGETMNCRTGPADEH
jgi:flavin-binding protein dodecin